MHRSNQKPCTILPEFADILMGLTDKVFGTDYTSTKKLLYQYLEELVQQIEKVIFW